MLRTQSVVRQLALSSLVLFALATGAHAQTLRDLCFEVSGMEGVEQPGDLFRSTLGKFRFEGVTFRTTYTQFKRMFPKARYEADKSDKAIGLDCYVVDKLTTADEARFYFFGGLLYQIEANYKSERIDSAGGLASLVQQMVTDLGPAQHVAQSRRTWQQPNIARRADLYTPGEGAQLVVTNTGLITRVQHETPNVLTKAVELGF